MSGDPFARISAESQLFTLGTQFSSPRYRHNQCNPIHQFAC